MWETIAGIVLLFGAVAQFYNTWRYFRRLQTDGGPNTSSFALAAIWTGAVFGVALLWAGVSCTFRLI